MSKPVQDRQTVTPDGKRLTQLPEGITFKECVTHVDERGTLCEIFDPRWGWHKDPVVYAYTFTIRPGVTKGWVMHKNQEDRLILLAGEMEMVLYDDREGSSTYGLVAKVTFSEYNRRLMNLPAGIWHAATNIGNKDVVMVNLPTRPYDHANPDKYRLPLNTDRIPYTFDHPRGW
jgi:dTDP-4-dehydrorhamnose 3,5-epimerase